MLVFIEQAVKQDLLFTQSFLKSDYFPQLLVQAFVLLDPKSLNQDINEPKLQELVDLDLFHYQSKEFQKEVSKEYILRCGLLSVGDLITHQLLNRNSQT